MVRYIRKFEEIKLPLGHENLEKKIKILEKYNRQVVLVQRENKRFPDCGRFNWGSKSYSLDMNHGSYGFSYDTLIKIFVPFNNK